MNKKNKRKYNNKSKEERKEGAEEEKALKATRMKTSLKKFAKKKGCGEKNEEPKQQQQ